MSCKVIESTLRTSEAVPGGYKPRKVIESELRRRIAVAGVVRC